MEIHYFIQKYDEINTNLISRKIINVCDLIMWVKWDFQFVREYAVSIFMQYFPALLWKENESEGGRFMKLLYFAYPCYNNYISAAHTAATWKPA